MCFPNSTSSLFFCCSTKPNQRSMVYNSPPNHKSMVYNSPPNHKSMVYITIEKGRSSTSNFLPSFTLSVTGLTGCCS